jgi:ABC-type antimicrobial peptide transport system permease subunit
VTRRPVPDEPHGLAALIHSGAGIIAGVAAGATAASFIRSMLFNASPQDPESIASAILFVIVMAAVAAAAPAIRATRTEPAEALRCE